MLFSTSANTNPQIIYSLFRGKQHIYLSIVRSKYVVKCISKILKIGWQIQKLCPKIILNRVFSIEKLQGRGVIIFPEFF